MVSPSLPSLARLARIAKRSQRGIWELRAWLLDLAGPIGTARPRVGEPIPVNAVHRVSRNLGNRQCRLPPVRANHYSGVTAVGPRKPRRSSEVIGVAAPRSAGAASSYWLTANPWQLGAGRPSPPTTSGWRAQKAIPCLKFRLRRQEQIEPLLKVRHFASCASVPGIEHKGLAGLFDRQRQILLYGGSVFGVPGVLRHLLKRFAHREVWP
jgi:hypothetical protein